MLIDTTATGYTFFDLNERARARALHAVAQADQATWDAAEPDQLAAALATALATGFGQPHTSRTDLDITVWDARRWSLAGTLHPATAPALPWEPGIYAVSIAWHRRIHIHAGGKPATADVKRMRTAVESTIATAWQAAHQQVSAWQALEWVATYGPRFTAAGALAPAKPRQHTGRGQR